MGKIRKLSDKEFFAILRENAGLFARTAVAIQKQFGIEYSRQAVRERAMKNPDELADIEENNIDIAEEGLHTLMRSKNENVRIRAIDLYLKTKGKKRGYVEKQEIETSIKGDKIGLNLTLCSDAELATIERIINKSNKSGEV